MSRDRRFIIEQAKIFKALGHPSRLLMVDALRNGELCVCDLQKMIGDDMSTVSRHLAVLHEAGIVNRRKDGTTIYYNLILCCLSKFLACTQEHVEKRIEANWALLSPKK